MSVHRAGSFYGVPHSTLEYKVKERNLLRHKTRKTSINLLTNNTNISHENEKFEITSSVEITEEDASELNDYNKEDFTLKEEEDLMEN